MSDRIYLYALGHYLAWVQIFDPQAGFLMGPRDTVTPSLWQYAIHLVQIPNFVIGRSFCIITEPRPYFMVGLIQGGCSSFTNSSQHIEPIWPQDLKLWFISPKDFIPLLKWVKLHKDWTIDYPVFVQLDPLKPFDIVLLPQQWFLDSNSTI